ncbi:MAG TPA: DUF4190 domain-containing protein [Pirellulales bacterium]|jgi:hypothetical protein|nr:DUF4190 domain-containing protein [Pirellulales bacterium]
MTIEPAFRNLPPSNSIEYRSIEPWALGGLLWGFLSPLALFGQVMGLVPIVGILVNLVALRHIKLDSNRTGRTAALAGLALSIAFLTTPIGQWAANRVMLARQPRPLADKWFEYLRESHPEKALLLRYAPDRRPPVDEDAWVYFRNDDEAKDELRAFVKDPLIRALLALGEKAQVRFYKTEATGGTGSLGGVQYIYAVTYDAADRKQTFFVSIILERRPTRNPDLNPWRVTSWVQGTDYMKAIARQKRPS